MNIQMPIEHFIIIFFWREYNWQPINTKNKIKRIFGKAEENNVQHRTPTLKNTHRAFGLVYTESSQNAVRKYNFIHETTLQMLTIYFNWWRKTKKHIFFVIFVDICVSKLWSSMGNVGMKKTFTTLRIRKIDIFPHEHSQEKSFKTEQWIFQNNMKKD